jgi:H+/gluconate symporter-like permease
MSGSWVAYSAATWSLIFAVFHVLWALGWYLGLPASQAQKTFSRTWFLIYDLVVAGLCVLGVLVAVALARRGSSKRMNRLAVGFGCVGTAVLALRAGGGFLQSLYLVATQQYVFELMHLYDLWFGLGAVLFAISTWRFWRDLSSETTRAAA